MLSKQALFCITLRVMCFGIDIASPRYTLVQKEKFNTKSNCLFRNSVPTPNLNRDFSNFQDRHMKFVITSFCLGA